ncbi:MAG TPA: hypothetical protein P5169_06130 [Kiritimatiellia bacterium]|nr:hypothetical protein [Kiritimatiellia bacterium]
MNMHKRIAIALIIFSSACWASEEDYAAITAIRMETMTTENTFGMVIVSATFTNGMEGTIFTSLSIDADGKTLSVPAEKLQDAARVYPASIMVSSSVGYPEAGLEPNLYIRFSGHDGTKPAKYCVIFDPSGFKGIQKESIQPSDSPSPPAKHPVP